MKIITLPIVVIFISALGVLIFTCDTGGNVAAAATAHPLSTVALSIFLPHDFIRLRNFQVCINRELAKLNRDAHWSFHNRFAIDM